MAQLIKRSLPAPVDLGSNPDIGNFYLAFVLLLFVQKRLKYRKIGNGPLKKILEHIKESDYFH